MTYPDIIGLNGVARAGKDTVGKILHDIYGYEIKSFSDVLNDALLALNPMVALAPEEFDPERGALRLSHGTGGGWTNYATLIEARGYEKAKDEPEVRRLLQRMGTEVGRDMLGQNIWVDALFRSYVPGERWVIVNVRFPNEADAVWSRLGEVWEVTRPGFVPALGHSSDTALDHIRKDLYIDNNGTVKDLADKVIDQMDGPDVRRLVNAIFNRGGLLT